MRLWFSCLSKLFSLSSFCIIRLMNWKRSANAWTLSRFCFSCNSRCLCCFSRRIMRLFNVSTSVNTSMAFYFKLLITSCKCFFSSRNYSVSACICEISLSRSLMPAIKSIFWDLSVYMHICCWPIIVFASVIWPSSDMIVETWFLSIRFIILIFLAQNF